MVFPAEGWVWKSLLILLLHLRAQSLCSSHATAPMKCKDTNRLCTSFLAYKRHPHQTLDVVRSMFDVLPQDLTFEGADEGYVFVKKNCSCFLPTHEYLTGTTFTVRNDGGLVSNMVAEAYDGLAVVPNTSRAARVGAVVSLRLLCGCSSELWNYLMSYVLREGDSVMSLASRFGVSMDNIGRVNQISSPENVTVGALYYIPLNSAPGDLYSSVNHTAPVPAPSVSNFSGEVVKHKGHAPHRWIIGGFGIVVALIILVIVICVSLWASSHFSRAPTSHAKDHDGKSSHKFNVLQKKFCCAPGRYTCCGPSDMKQTDREFISTHIPIPRAFGTGVFDMEKPVVFTYEEVLSSTDGFSDSNLLGHGTYGSVYYGVLRDQEVAIKRMTATKTMEFLAEIKVLCTVHHTNLVELIGYAVSDNDLFLMHEYAPKGSLKSHLRDSQNKGHTSLSWIMRVQIALDAARGLEYIHEHTKTHYVHRDIKTSNILLDSAFRAKIAYFGLAKLVGQPDDGEAKATKVVGTYGYLAPEYLHDGLATTRSDVFAFGVVLFEIITGRQAVTHTKTMATKDSERRTLVSIMSAALGNTRESMNMSTLKSYIDPTLMDLYPYDCVFKVGMLAKQCVDEDPILRPDMKQVVISLSHILLSSVEWEAALAGNSQVFSGLVQGR